MDGIDVTWNRVPGGAGIGRLAADALAAFKPDDPSASVPALLAIRAQLASLPADPLIADKRAQLDRILQACLGLQVETTMANAEVVPGEPLTLHYTLSVTAKNVTVHHVVSHSSAVQLAGDNPRDLAAGEAVTGELTGVLPPETLPTQPYWLRADGAAGISRVDDPALIGRPMNPPAIPIEHVFTVNGQTLVVADEPVQLVAGASAAQARRPVTVIPPVSLAFNSDIYLIAPGKTKTVTIEVSAARASTRGTLRLAVPAGWQVAPAAQDFRLAAAGEKALLAFQVTALPDGWSGQTPAGQQAGTVTSFPGRFTATAEIDGRRYSNERYEINYAHLPRMLLQPAARARVASFEFATRGLNVGYLPGSGDNVDVCLEQMGYFVRRLTGADLTPEKLAGLDAVVLGVRAFNERDDLKDAFPGLLAWVEAGGTVIAQYNRPDRKLKTEQLGPYALSIQGQAPQWRVTDETAPITILAPDHAAVNAPNKIEPADFNGWVQERGAYFPSSWDKDHYTALLGMSDPGEAPLQGGILVAKYGKGHYVYTGIGFFRQLPAGVPGAYRLFANLLSLGK